MSAVAKTRLYDNSELLESIDLFFQRQDSDKTYGTYEKHVRLFFNHVLGKDINQLTLNDIKNIRFRQFEKFIVEMSGELAGTTINQRVSAVKSLLRYLNGTEFSELDGKELNLNLSFFEKIKRVPEDTSGYGVLSVDEVFKMADLCLNRKHNKKGKIQSLLILFAVDTCLRKSAILSLNWDDFEVRDDGVYFEVIDKGNKEARKIISYEFYEMLLELKVPGQKKVFNLSQTGVDRMMETLRKEMNINPKRKIVFHSVRKGGVTFQYRLHNDIVAARDAAGHSDLNTTLKYIQTRDYGSVGAVSINKEVQNFDLNSLDKETLIELIKDSGKDTELILKKKAVDLLNKKKNIQK